MARQDTRTPPGKGPIAQQLRLYSGLVLFAFAATHFLNHALGNISLDLAQKGQDLRIVVWWSWPGTILLYGALLLHVGFALYRIAMRRTFRMPAWEALQIVLGLAIPYLLIRHIAMTRGAVTRYHSFLDYQHELSVLWPGSGLTQSFLLVIVWLHGCIGLHFWLRLKPWYPNWRGTLLALAVAVPILSLTGWINAARRLVLEGQFQLKVTAEQTAELQVLADAGRIVFFSLLLVAVAVSLLRQFGAIGKRPITVHYLGEKSVRARPGPTLLEISRMKGVPHMSVCGGRARCSTCRTLIVSGAGNLAQPGPTEQQVLQRIHAGKNVRLACQVRPATDLVVRPLLNGGAAFPREGLQDRYRWGTEQPVVVMFVDLRGFTALSEGRLPFDVVFILNRYVDSVVRVIRKHDGMIDKVMGDGIMALFGVESGMAGGSRSALAAIVDLAEELKRVNRDLAAQLSAPLRIAVGLHGGSAILGRIGLDGRNGVASGLTALGDVVNVASRLEGVAKEQNALAAISLDVLKASGAGLDPFMPLLQVPIRGRLAPLDVACPSSTAPILAALERAAVA
ncbi:adenylate/guanylate cyclase domain-containing protein [Pannonibacter carbonis]|uniref:adenylate/guanylate cyclase domain-containing protein n=1 Tax=Pannonibacter carbonis TaxID=2067569 RepID=UPI000D0E6B54|nr:adenylate/guanylate cyclase domain-containing protein [Pannonibacter carbonis]